MMVLNIVTIVILVLESILVYLIDREEQKLIEEEREMRRKKRDLT